MLIAVAPIMPGGLFRNELSLTLQHSFPFSTRVESRFSR